jgi:hypothetical protein
MYAACEVALVTPLRDGMNLIAKEYIASRADQKGVLILSEMAGAMEELDALLVINPNTPMPLPWLYRKHSACRSLSKGEGLQPCRSVSGSILFLHGPMIFFPHSGR